MEALQYRSTVWICGKLGKDIVIPNKACHAVPLFVFIIERNPSWGRYAVYTTWLHMQFPSQGQTVLPYLKTRHPDWVYSFSYLASQYIVYHVVRKSFTTWFLLVVSMPLVKRLSLSLTLINNLNPNPNPNFHFNP